RFARLASRTGVVTTWAPPDAKNGIMSTTIDAQGNAWFVEQGANYIGRFDPARQTFRIFPLGTAQGRPMGPQALQFDARGLLWFTEIGPGKLGMIDPATNRIIELPVPVMSGHPPFLYGLVVAHNGDVWFANNGANALVRYVPDAATYTFFQLSASSGGLYGLTLDPAGHLWFTASGSSANAVGEMNL